MTAPDPTAGERASCGCVIGGLHRYECAGVGHVDPPAVAAPTGTSEDVEALAEACWLLDSGDPTWGWENLLPEQQDHHREQVKILAPVVERIVAAREAAARTEERERIAQAIEAERDLDPRTPFGLGLASAAQIAREAR